MKLSRTHLDAINESQAGELVIANHPDKPIVLMNVKGTMVGMEMAQVDALIARLQAVRAQLIPNVTPV